MVGSHRGRIEARGVSKRFGAVEVLRDAEVTVEAGRFATLLGPSGCGKTTLLRIVAGLESADRGQVLLDGRDLIGLQANQRPVNTVFQSYALFPHLSVAENVAFGLRSRRVAEADVAKRVADALEMLRIDDLRGRRPAQLSGGQRQRVALARALVNEPDVLLLDEPLSALDARLRSDVQLELKRLQRRLGTTFLLVTHDQDEAMVVSDDILVMQGGRIVQHGSPREVYERPSSRFVAEFLGSANLIPARWEGGRARCEAGELTPSTTPTWAEGTLAIRPERIAIRDGAPAANGVRARVREAVFRGDVVDLFCDPASLRVRIPAGAAPVAGDEVWLELAPAHLHPLDG
jgi:spermidine/putrescine transport system ATP-binding protein